MKNMEKKAVIKQILSNNNTVAIQKGAARNKLILGTPNIQWKRHEHAHENEKEQKY